MAAAAEREIAQQDDRQEQENKGVGIEEHRAFPARPKGLTIQRKATRSCIAADLAIGVFGPI
jgi:hypothetical protein